MQYGILRGAPSSPSQSTTFSLAAPRGLRAAYGPEAEVIATRFRADLPLLFCDGADVDQALAAARRRRYEGQPFLVTPLMNDPQSLLSRTAALNIYNQFKDVHQRLDLFASLADGTMHFNGAPIFQNSVYSPQNLDTLSEIAQLGDGLFVRSQMERMRIEAALHTQHLYVAVAPVINDHVPHTRPHRDAGYVVVWAPDEDAMSLATYAFALQQLNKAAIFVCRGKIPNAPHHFVGLERAEDALANATVVVDTQIADPGTALAFAGRGFGLAASITTGAHEYIQGLATYSMHDFASIATAIDRAAHDRRAFALPLPDTTAIIRATLAAARISS